jgi:hypothetical protein
MWQVLLIPLPGVLRGQAGYYRGGLGWSAQVFGGAANDQHMVSAFQVHRYAWIGGKIAGFDSAALAVQVQDATEHYSSHGAACGSV